MADFENTLRNSGTRFELEGIASEIFCIWIKTAGLEHNVAAAKAQKYSSNGQLNEDFTNCFLDAFRSEKSIGTQEKRARNEWSYGYICGYIQGNLETKWYDQFIFKRSEKYRELLETKALIEFLKLSSAPSESIGQIHEHLLHEESGIIEETNTSSGNVFYLKDRKGTAGVKANEIQKRLVGKLEKSLLLDYYKTVEGESEHMFCPDVTDYFSCEKIESFLNCEQ